LILETLGSARDLIKRGEATGTQESAIYAKIGSQHDERDLDVGLGQIFRGQKDKKNTIKH
jgi:hypothetical protein